jgi:hypothetical protein
MEIILVFCQKKNLLTLPKNFFIYLSAVELKPTIMKYFSMEEEMKIVSWEQDLL